MYQWNPCDYEKNSSPQERAADAVISTLELIGDEHILDIGCGDGKVTARISARIPNGSVLGIDSSSEMIDFARNKFPSSKYPNLRFELADALNLSYDQEFDLVVSFACLHWVKDHLSVLRGIKRSLKPGGIMVIQCGGRGAEDDIFALAREVIRGDKWSNYFQGYSNPHGVYGTEEYHAWLKEAGLEEIKVGVSARDMIFPGKAGLEGFIRTTWLSLTERIPEELRQEFISEMADRYLEQKPIRDGLAYAGMGVLEVEARRTV